MRERYQTNKTTVNLGYSVYDENNTLTSSGTFTMPVNAHDYDYMSDIVTPSFKIRQAKGEVIINPLLSARSKVTEAHGSMNRSYTLYDHPSGTVIDGARYEHTNPTSSWVLGDYVSIAERIKSGLLSSVSTQFNLAQLTDLESSLITRARDNASSNQALALVTLAELDKTVALFQTGASMTADLINRLDHVPLPDLQKLKRLRIRDMRKLVNSLPRKGWEGVQKAAAMWLGYRYGIMATYYDVVSWFDAGSQVGAKLRGRFTSSSHTSYTPSDSISAGDGDAYYTSEIRVRLARTSSSTAGVLVQAVPQAGAAESFGLYNLLSSAWELVPYSFVVDWFADVGKRLAALEGSVLRPVLGSWVVHRSKLYYEMSNIRESRNYVSGAYRYAGNGMENTSASVFDSCDLVQRIANPPFSALPNINVKLNMKRVLDGISLLTTSSAKLKRLVR